MGVEGADRWGRGLRPISGKELGEVTSLLPLFNWYWTSAALPEEAGVEAGWCVKGNAMAQPSFTRRQPCVTPSCSRNPRCLLFVFLPTFPSLTGFYAFPKTQSWLCLCFPRQSPVCRAHRDHGFAAPRLRLRPKEASRPQDNSLSAPLSGRTLRG